MNLIRRHKGLAIVGCLALVLLIIMFIIFARMIFTSNNGEYGNRLNGLIKVDKSIIEKVAGAKFTVIVKITDVDDELLKADSQMEIEIPYTTTELNTGFQAYHINDKTILTKNTTYTDNGIVCQAKNNEKILV